MKKIIDPLGSPEHSLRGGLRRLIIVKFKVRRLQKNFFSRMASMHPRNDIKNGQVAPTSGTFPKEGLKSFYFCKIQKSSTAKKTFSAELLRCTQGMI